MDERSSMFEQQLLHLPNEIKIKIIDELGPNDTWSLAQTSKVFNNFCQSAIRNHKELFKKAPVVRLALAHSHGTGFEGGQSPLLYLIQVFREPTIASYVTDLRFSHYWHGQHAKFDFDPSDIGGRPIKLYTVIRYVKNKLADLGLNCPVLSEAQRRDWRGRLGHYSSQVHHLAILLTILPNLRSLTLSSLDWEYEPIMEMVRAIVKANRDLSSPAHDKLLSKLGHVSVDNWDVERGRPSFVYAPFIDLPSLRSIYGYRIRGDVSPYNSPFGHHDRPIQQSQIEDIKIVRCEIGPATWGTMLNPVKNLKRLTYEHDIAMAEASNKPSAPRYDPVEIMSLLRHSACHSLQRLELTCNTSNKEERQLAGDLKDFEVLRVLKISDMAFLTHENIIVRLVDTLPPLIRHLTLVSKVRNDPIKLFDRLAEEKDKLPKLKYIRLKGGYILPKHLVARCRCVGIDLKGILRYRSFEASYC